MMDEWLYRGTLFFGGYVLKRKIQEGIQEVQETLEKKDKASTHSQPTIVYHLMEEKKKKHQSVK